MPTTLRHSIPLLVGGQAEGHVTHNTALNGLDAFINASVLSKTVSDPSTLSPVNGDLYIVGASPVGEWSTHANKLALYMSGWQIYVPPTGFVARVNDEQGSYYVYNGSWTGIGIRDAGFYQKPGRYFLPGMTTFGSATALTSGTFTASRLYAVPFVVPRGGTLDQVSINITTTGNFNTNYSNIGIYRSTSLDDFTPGTKIWDSTALIWGTTGVQNVTVSNIRLWPGCTYWMAWNSAASTGQMRLNPPANMRTIGYLNATATAASVGLYVAHTHTGSAYVLPTTYPSSPTDLTAAPIPAIFYRLA
jgi:hypothetical protein